MKELIDRLNELVVPPDKSRALPFLGIRQLSGKQLQEIGAQVSAGQKTPFNHTDIQNWVKRGYLARDQKGAKQYTPSEAANLLLFADLKDVLGLEGAHKLLQYMNGDPNTTTDDLLDPSRLYEYYAKVYDATAKSWQVRLGDRVTEAATVLEGEPLSEFNRQKLTVALVVLTLVAQADFYREMALAWLAQDQSTVPESK